MEIVYTRFLYKDVECGYYGWLCQGSIRMCEYLENDDMDSDGGILYVTY